MGLVGGGGKSGKQHGVRMKMRGEEIKLTKTSGGDTRRLVSG